MPLLAIVIPTRNRLQYVKHAINSLSKIKHNDIEIVIEDNSDTKELQVWLECTYDDHRIKYHYSSNPASQKGNYNRSMENVTAEYVTFIGDDDGVNPMIVNAVLWGKRHGYDAIVPTTKASYVWPDLCMDRKSAIAPGEVRIHEYTSEIHEPDPELEICKCLKDCAQKFHKLPKAYFGIVRRELLEEVRRLTGSYFPGVSPDISSAIALAIVVKRYCYIDYPLFLPGASYRSNSGLSGLNRHIGKLTDQPHLDEEDVYNWTRYIPTFFSVETIWAEAAIEAIVLSKRYETIKLIPYRKLYSNLIVKYNKYCINILSAYLNIIEMRNQNIVKEMCKLLSLVNVTIVIQGIAFVKRKMRYMMELISPVRKGSLKAQTNSRYVSITSIANIDDAVVKFSECMESEVKRKDPFID